MFSRFSVVKAMVTQVTLSYSRIRHWIVSSLCKQENHALSLHKLRTNTYELHENVPRTISYEALALVDPDVIQSQFSE